MENQLMSGGTSTKMRKFTKSDGKKRGKNRVTTKQLKLFWSQSIGSKECQQNPSECKGCLHFDVNDKGVVVGVTEDGDYCILLQDKSTKRFIATDITEEEAMETMGVIFKSKEKMIEEVKTEL